MMRPIHRPVPDNFSSAFLFLGYLLAGFFVAQFAGLISILPFFAFDFEQATGFLSTYTESSDSRTPLLVLQATYSFFLFFATPAFYVIIHANSPLTPFFRVKVEPFSSFGLTVLLMMIYMPFSSFLVAWNEQITLPSSLAEFEFVLRSLEDEAQAITLFLINFDSGWQFLGGLMVLAVLPGIGEEFLFRGILQPAFARWSGNVHVGIWLSAFFFSAFHFQFYGFFPRMALGVLFGYLYVYSGSLPLAMFAHFLNNAFSLVMVYFFSEGTTDMEAARLLLEDENSLPWGLAIVSLLSVFGMMYYLKNRFATRFVDANHDPKTDY